MFESAELEEYHREVVVVDDELYPEQVEEALARMRSQQRFGRAVVVGVAACLVGAVLWAVVTAVTRVQIGWMAIGIGALVGLSMRRFGRGVEAHFGYVGAGLALFGCLLGNFLTVYVVVATEFEIPLVEAASVLSAGAVARVTFSSFDMFDLLFYGLAIFEGYRLAFREVTYGDLLVGTDLAVDAGDVDAGDVDGGGVEAGERQDDVLRRELLAEEASRGESGRLFSQSSRGAAAARG